MANDDLDCFDLMDFELEDFLTSIEGLNEYEASCNFIAQTFANNCEGDDDGDDENENENEGSRQVSASMDVEMEMETEVAVDKERVGANDAGYETADDDNTIDNDQYGK